MNHYEVLGVTPSASLPEIQIAYRVQVKLTHPDNGGSTALFRLVQEAYEVLGDPVARAVYDRDLASGQDHRGADQSSSRSAGGGGVEIPLVVGMSAPQACVKLEYLGLEPVVVQIIVAADDPTIGIVVDQQPVPGSVAESTLNVRLVVPRGATAAEFITDVATRSRDKVVTWANDRRREREIARQASRAAEAEEQRAREAELRRQLAEYRHRLGGSPPAPALQYEEKWRKAPSWLRKEVKAGKGLYVIRGQDDLTIGRDSYSSTSLPDGVEAVLCPDCGCEMSVDLNWQKIVPPNRLRAQLCPQCDSTIHAS